MNNFREWLSDNLRYIMLGVGIILALVLIFFGVRFLSAHFGTTTNSGNTTIGEETPTPTEAPEATVEVQPEQTAPIETGAEAPTPADGLQQNGVSTVVALVNNYYTALASKDINSLRQTVDTLSAEDEAAIMADDVEQYNNVNVYTNALDTDGCYLVLASYEYKLPNINTLVPGLGQLYVRTNESGAPYIVTETPSAEDQALIDAALQREDAQTLIAQTQSQFDAALASDPALNAYFNPQAAEATPEPTPEAAPEATPEPAAEAAPADMITLTQSANLRNAPTMTGSTILRTITAGTQMTRLGEENGWYHVNVDGVDGYIYNEYF